MRLGSWRPSTIRYTPSAIACGGRGIRTEETQYTRVSETLRANRVDLEVSGADPVWQSEQLSGAMPTLVGKGSQEESRHAARVLRFLSTKDSTRALAKLFWG
jgi:hypothetical protein